MKLHLVFRCNDVLLKSLFSLHMGVKSEILRIDSRNQCMRENINAKHNDARAVVSVIKGFLSIIYL